MSNTRYNLGSLVYQLQTDLSNYINNRGVIILKDGATYTPPYRHTRYVLVKHPTKNITVVHESESYPKKLTCERVLNAIDIKDNLENEIKHSRELNKADAMINLERLKNILIEGQQENNRLSSKYNKTHLSSAQNREAGQNMLKAWWNKSWCQSGANTAIENALNNINTYMKSKGLSLEPKEEKKQESPSKPFGFQSEPSSSITTASVPQLDKAVEKVSSLSVETRVLEDRTTKLLAGARK